MTLILSHGIHTIKIEDKKSETIEEFTLQSRVINNIMAQSETEIGCNYSDKIEIFPSNLSINSKLSELTDCKDPLLIFNTKDIERNKIIEELKSIKSRLDNIENDNAFLKADNASLKFDNGVLKSELLYPLLIRELLKQSR